VAGSMFVARNVSRKKREGAMGQGIELAKLLNPENEGFIQLLDELKEQLLLVFIERLGGKVVVPVIEIDTAPLGKILTMGFNQEKMEFVFEVKKKN